MTGTPTTEVNGANPNRRVKVYVLGGDGQWDDRGTGYVTCEMIPEYDSVGFRVLAENASEKKELLVSKIFDEDVFQRQGDTIVTWTNPETREDVALSFQEAVGAQEVWELICQVQGRSPNDPLELEADGVAAGAALQAAEETVEVKVPSADMSNLQALQDLVQNATTATRERIVDGVMQEGYLKRLFQIFRDCEDLEMTNSLHTLFRIFKGLIMLNEPSLIEKCLSDEHVLDTMGILEHDPDYANHEIKHREYLGNPKLFKQAVPIKDETTVQKIHLNFRLTYLKDVVMARYIDDVSFSTIRELISLNNVEIIGQIQSDSELLNQLFALCRNVSESDKRRNGFLFLRELFEITKPLSMPHQMQFFRSLSAHGLFSILERAVEAADMSIVSAGTDIMLCTLNHEASLLRGYLLEGSGRGLLKSLIRGLLHFQDTGLKAQVTEILRCLLDASSMEQSPERDRFLELFYCQHIDTLLSPFLDADAWGPDGTYLADKEEAKGKGEESEAARRRDGATAGEKRESWDAARKHCVELLSQCVEQHGPRIMTYMLRNEVLPRALKLLTQRDKHLVLAALKLLRQCIGANEAHCNKYIVKKDLFSGVIALLKQHLHRNNLINSAIIELFEFLRSKNIKPLIKYLVEQYRSVYENIEYVDTFKQLIVRYEQNEEYEKDVQNGNVSPDGTHQTWGGGRRGRGVGVGSFRSKVQEDEDEERYFEQDDDDDDKSGGSAALNKIEEPADDGLSGLAALTEYEGLEEGAEKSPAKAGEGDGAEKAGDGGGRERGSRESDKENKTEEAVEPQGREREEAGKESDEAQAAKRAKVR